VSFELQVGVLVRGKYLSVHMEDVSVANKGQYLLLVAEVSILQLGTVRFSSLAYRLPQTIAHAYDKYYRCVKYMCFEVVLHDYKL
jgi:hypothetical protein